MRKKSIFKRIVISLVLVLSLGLSLQVSSFFKCYNNAYAKDGEIANGDFQNPSSGTTNPFAPNNFTQVGTKNDYVKAGIIYLDENNFEKYRDDYGLTGSFNNYADLGACPDSKALLINNTHSRLSIGTGFKSDSFTLTANKYYKLSLYARTINYGFGTIILNDDNTTTPRLYSTKSVRSAGWSIYTFYIETDKLTSTQASLSLWLGESDINGSIGGVMFDSITLSEIDKTSYEGASKVDANANIISLVNNSNKVQLIENATFETSEGLKNSSNWTLSLEGQYNRAEVWDLTTSIATDLIPGDYKNSTQQSYGYVLYSENEGYATVTSDEFIIKQNEVIELSFYAKVTEGTTASVKLYSTAFYKNGEKVNIEDSFKYNFSGTSTISLTNNKFTNNYGLYKFLIKGNYYYDTAVKLDLNLGTSENKTKGYVVFDDFSTCRLNSSLQKLSEQSSNLTKVNLFVGSTSSGTVSNGYFNFVDSVEYSNNFEKLTYPLNNVSGFSKNFSDENNVVSGIIDVNNKHFEEHISEYGTVTNPRSPSTINNSNSLTATNNVLLIRNINKGYASYISTDTKSLSKNSYYKVSVDAYLDKVAGNVGNAYFKVLDQDKNVLASLPVTTSTWENKQIYISTGLIDSTTISLALCLGEQNNLASGNAYFDNLAYTTSTADEYNNAVKSANKNILTLDLATFTFNNETELLDGTLYKTSQFTLSETSSEYSILGSYNTSPVGNSQNSLGAVMLKNTHAGISQATTNRGYSVEANNYYKISVFAKITDITPSNNYNTEHEYGAVIALENYKLNSNRFVNLKNTLDNNGFSIYNKFEFVISPVESETLKIVIGLGSTNDEYTEEISGSIYVDKIIIENISANDFENYSSNNLPDAVNGLKIGSDVADNENQNKPASRFQFNWWYFSSIILGLTLIVVLVGLLIKKVNWKKIFVKDEKTLAEYDTRRIENEQKALAKKELRARKKAQNKNKKTDN